jgi:CxxC-x17-CxxC domain-containing protein
MATTTRWEPRRFHLVAFRARVSFTPSFTPCLTVLVSSAQGPGSTCAAREEFRGVFEDRSLTCRDCGASFVFSAGEQAFFASKGLANEPQRCTACRAIAKRARSDSPPGIREYHVAICNGCGGQAMVPFQPRNDRPVYCSTCFDKVRATAASAPAGS